MRVKRFQGGYDKNFCYVISCNETRMAAIIDPAVEINPIIEYIEAEDLILDKILVTHTHHDHIYYLNDFIDLHPLVKVYASSNAAFKTKIDKSFGMVRVEYHCAKCGAHHGHVFNDGPKESGKRFCNNGLCLIFKPE